MTTQYPHPPVLTPEFTPEQEHIDALKFARDRIEYGEPFICNILKHDLPPHQCANHVRELLDWIFEQMAYNLPVHFITPTHRLYKRTPAFESWLVEMRVPPADDHFGEAREARLRWLDEMIAKLEFHL